jgi:hypothetical protein
MNMQKEDSDMLRCAMTGQVLRDTSEGIYDDGEWIGWDWINSQIYKNELREEYPAADPDLAELFEDLVENARHYHALTGRYLQIWGELGELYAQVKHGITLHRPHTQGSDGRLGNDLVEVKTISPEKIGRRVQVKRAGNFSKLLIVKISTNFEFESRMIDRRELKKGTGKHAHFQWKTATPRPFPSQLAAPAALPERTPKTVPSKTVRERTEASMAELARKTAD